MKSHYYALALIWLLALSCATAAQVDFQFSGTIINDRDDHGWFQGAFPLNGTFSGRIRYDSSLTTKQVNNIDPGFAYYVFNLGDGDPVALSVTGAGGHTFSSLTPFYVNTYDNYGVNPSYPSLTPFDELYYAAYPNFNFDNAPLTMNYYFADFGVHFNSTALNSMSTTDLPITPPDPSNFQDSYFNVYVFSGGGNGPLAYIRGAITSVAVIPEPTAGTLLLLGIGTLLSIKRR